MNDDPWNRPTKPDRDVHYRVGILMAEVGKLNERVAALNDRVAALEQLFDEQSRVSARARKTIRPTVERIGTSALVAGVVAGIVQGLAQLFR